MKRSEKMGLYQTLKRPKRKRNGFHFASKRKAKPAPPFFAICFSQVRFTQSIILLFEDFNYWLTAPE
jgi:hypothetical protein